MRKVLFLGLMAVCLGFGQAKPKVRAITGEERLREFLAGLYGDVDSYEGKPTDSQQARAVALAHELDDVVKEFAALTAAQLPGLNRDLQAKGMAVLK